MDNSKFLRNTVSHIMTPQISIVYFVPNNGWHNIITSTCRNLLIAKIEFSVEDKLPAIEIWVCQLIKSMSFQIEILRLKIVRDIGTSPQGTNGVEGHSVRPFGNSTPRCMRCTTNLCHLAIACVCTCTRNAYTLIPMEYDLFIWAGFEPRLWKYPVFQFRHIRTWPKWGSEL